MPSFISSLAILVPTYEAGIEFYVDALGFFLIEDTPLTPTKRWVRVAPSETAETSLLLARAANDTQKFAVGNQAGGRVFLFLQTTDFERDYTHYREKGVTFLEEPRCESYGKVVVFSDPFGNKWDLIEPHRDESN